MSKLLIAVAFFLHFVFPFETNRAGRLHFSQFNHESVYKKLRIYGDTLYLSSTSSVFQYDVRGALSLDKTVLYLSVNDYGKLVLDTQPHVGFKVTTLENLETRGTLWYLGVKEFQLCADNLIGYKSRCPGARLGTITFENRFHQWSI